jgi:hypothetical protein
VAISANDRIGLRGPFQRRNVRASACDGLRPSWIAFSARRAVSISDSVGNGALSQMPGEAWNSGKTKTERSRLVSKAPGLIVRLSAGKDVNQGNVLGIGPIVPSDIISDVAADLCKEQATLATAVVDAINRVHKAKRDIEVARERKAETDRLVIAPNKTRAEERRAIAALGQHKKEQGCKNNAS